MAPDFRAPRGARPPHTLPSMKKQAKAKKLTEVRIGVIGVGNMGTSHIRNIENGLIKRARLTAICDIVPSKMDRYGDKYLKFTDSRELIRSGEVDAVMPLVFVEQGLQKVAGSHRPAPGNP